MREIETIIETINKILKQNNFDIMYKDIDLVSEEEYVKIRMTGFGASDSSKLLNCNPFPNGDRLSLCKEKATGVYDETISKKASVRMGKDIEHIILETVIEKFTEIYPDSVLLKPPHMYGNEHHLNINYDGILLTTEDVAYPVEIKAVTKYGRKYYDFSKSLFKTKDGEWQPQGTLINKYVGAPISISDYCNTAAKHYGIPPYYFTQLQQQLMGTGSDFGYLVVMDVDNWDVHIFLVHKDEYVQSELNISGNIGWAMVEIQKEKGAK